MKSVPLLIAGGGPVGMTLANVLAHFGIQSMLVERNPETTRHPKMDITNGRSMELFRRFGLADALRRVAVSESHPFDVAWMTNLSGYELHRFRYASPQEYRAQSRIRNDGTFTLEPPMRVSQVEIEPVLKAAIDQLDKVDVRFGVALENYETDDEGVVATVRDCESGTEERVRCEFLVGCDGGSSRVREISKIKLEGQARIGVLYMVHFRSNERDILQRWGTAWHYQSPFGTMIAQNDKDIWTIHFRVKPDQDPASMNPRELVERFVGRSFDFEVLVANPWTPHLLLAESYGSHRVFLAGDSAHQYIPTGGYGMNTGIGDAVDLGWKLAATLSGWGGPKLLPSYEIERRPVGARNREASGGHMQVRIKIAEAYGAAIPEDGDGNTVSRAEVGARIARLGNAENESFGIEHGFIYSDSPIVADDDTEAFPFEPLTYKPTTRPGARLPSIFLEDGKALYDQLGPYFTLLNFGGHDTSAFASAAKRRNVPLSILTVKEAAARGVYGNDMLLVRPDHHIAWRGPTAENADQVLGMAAGWGESQ